MAAANVWSQMNYVPPRGQCNHKQSIVTSRCPCLRFMLHPLKSSSSYECDGCGHHASFHSMENKVDDEIRKRWEQEAKEQAEREAQEAQPKAKKRRAIEYNGATAAQYRAIGCDTEMAAINATLDMGLAAMRRQAPTRSTVGKRKATTGGVRTRGAAREDEEDTVVELD